MRGMEITRAQPVGVQPMSLAELKADERFNVPDGFGEGDTDA